MITARAPYRISLFGGGGDISDWYLRNGGQFLSTTIDKFVYVTIKSTPPFFDYKIRVVWNQIEQVLLIDDVKNPIVREVLKNHFPDSAIEIHYQGDLPARSGMGSSSSFCVALIGALYAFKGIEVDQKELANFAIDVERNKLKEAGGIQDQIAAAFGGFNHVKIDCDGDFKVLPMIENNKNIETLEDHLLLFFTGKLRDSYALINDQQRSSNKHQNTLDRMQELVTEAIQIIQSGTPRELGPLMLENWSLKKSLASTISTPAIESAIEAGVDAGALSSKVLGAGGGGFVLFLVESKFKAAVRKRLDQLIEVPVVFENQGFKIVYEG